MKAGRGYIPIELKAVVAALVIILAAIGTISWINLERAHEANQRSLQSLTAGYASSIAVASELPLAVRDQNELDRLLSRYLRSEQIIEFVAILDESGELVSSASRDDLEEALLTTCSTGESSDSESAHTSNDYTIGTAEVLTLSSDVSSVFDDFGFQAPAVDPESGSATDVYPSLETLGHVHVGTSNEGLRTLHARGIRSAVTTTLVAMVLCSIGVTFFVRRWSTRLQKLMDSVGKEHLVLDLSCRKRVVEGAGPESPAADAAAAAAPAAAAGDSASPAHEFVVVTDRWQKWTDFVVNAGSLSTLAAYCDEFLVHGVDVEGRQCGVEEELVAVLGAPSPIPVTYAGGVRNMADIELVQRVGKGRVDVTVGSALDIFGGALPFEEVVKWHRSRAAGSA